MSAMGSGRRENNAWGLFDSKGVSESDVFLLCNQFVHLLTTFLHLPWKVEFDTHPSFLIIPPFTTVSALPSPAPKHALSLI